MRQQIIEQYFKTSSLSSFNGSLQSLAQIISRGTGVYVHGDDVLKYLYTNNRLQNYCINICFRNGEIHINISTKTCN